MGGGALDVSRKEERENLSSRKMKQGKLPKRPWLEPKSRETWVSRRLKKRRQRKMRRSLSDPGNERPVKVARPKRKPTRCVMMKQAIDYSRAGRVDAKAGKGGGRGTALKKKKGESLRKVSYQEKGISNLA